MNYNDKIDSQLDSELSFTEENPPDFSDNQTLMPYHGTSYSSSSRQDATSEKEKNHFN